MCRGKSQRGDISQNKGLRTIAKSNLTFWECPRPMGLNPIVKKHEANSILNLNTGRSQNIEVGGFLHLLHKSAGSYS
jgi:hypothetical protein